MKSPIRVVCEGCLRSVELALDFVLTEGTECPFCGRRLDRSTAERGSSEADTHVPDGPDVTDGPETIDWAAAWSRGSLGSLGRFQLRERLGDGGFGQVYLAYD